MAENDTLIREVNDALREERLTQFWRYVRLPIFYAALALILVTAGSSVWKQYQQSQAEEVTMGFAKAQEHYRAGHYKKAANAFEQTAQSSRGELADIARLWQARALLAQDKTKDAMRALQTLALAPEGQDFMWRDLACLQLAGLAKSTPKTCAGEMDSPLRPLLAQYHAAALWRSGKDKAAREVLAGLGKDKGLSPSLRAQIRALEQTILLAPKEKHARHPASACWLTAYRLRCACAWLDGG